MATRRGEVFHEPVTVRDGLLEGVWRELEKLRVVKWGRACDEDVGTLREQGALGTGETEREE
jgi:hypothetical protein